MSSGNDFPGELTRSAAPILNWMSAALIDQIDYGILVVDASLSVHFSNRCARQRLSECALALQGDRLTVDGFGVGTAACAPLQDAIGRALTQGFRRLLRVGMEKAAVDVAVVPLQDQTPEYAGCVLLLVGRRQVCPQLSAYWFARIHHLTIAEARVFDALCDGHEPSRIAQLLGVRVSTVRTQISTIRAKTGADSIGSLVRRAAQLPPMIAAIEQAR